MKIVLATISLIMTLSLQASGAEVVERIVAIVNNQAVTLSDLKDFERQLADSALVDELLTGGKSLEQLKNDPKARLDYLINERLVDSLIKKKGLTVTSDRVEKELRQMAASNGITREQLVSRLAEEGIQLSTYQDFLKTRIERQSLIEQEVSSKIQISDEEVLTAYAQQSQGKNKTAREYTLSHILFLPEQGDRSKALERAQKVLKELRQNQGSFRELAKKYSEDPNFSDGGRLGTFRSGEILPEIDQAISSLEEGQTTGVIQTGAGFHIVRLDDVKIIPDPAFSRQKEELRARLFQNAFQNYFASWIEQQRTEAFVRIN